MLTHGMVCLREARCIICNNICCAVSSLHSILWLLQAFNRPVSHQAETLAENHPWCAGR